jgi:hypothetical protein
VSHAAGTGGLPSLGLLAPVDCNRVKAPQLISVDTASRRTLAGLSGGVSAGGASVLLDVEGTTTCNTIPSVQCVRALPSSPGIESSSRQKGCKRTATPAQRVRLVVALAEAGSSLRYSQQSALESWCCRFPRGSDVLIVD